MERQLASVKRIDSLTPIEGADKIELALVGGWPVVVQKELHKEGDLVIYCEIDSFLPIKPEYEFLRKSSYKKMGDKEGFRLKTVRLRGQVSQGLILPIREVLPGQTFEEGTDVTELLGIVKYEKPIAPNLAGIVKGNFPSFIPKTDENRIQNLSREWSYFKTLTWTATEKLEGSSDTMYLKDGVFGVCSRNLELKEDETNTFWQVARKLNIEERLREYGVNMAIQGELIGPGIQDNIYKLTEPTVRIFKVFFIDTQTYASPFKMVEIANSLGLLTVPILGTNIQLPETIQEVIEMSDGNSALYPTLREGIVYVAHDEEKDKVVSFKAISNKYLINEK